MAQKVLGQDIIPTLKSKIETATGAVDTKVTSLQTEVDEINTNLNKDVQFDTTVDGDESTVTITKTTGKVSEATPTETGLPLPVASNTQAGVVNSATYKTITETAEKVDALLGSTVMVADLPAEPTQEQLTDAWKTATGKTELINGASIFDQTNNKNWTYYANTDTWVASDTTAPTIELKAFTNEAAGIIKGSTNDGQVSAESDGTGSVNGWDTLSAQVSTNKSSIESLETSVDTNTNNITALQSGKQDKLVDTGEAQNIKTINGQSVLGPGNIDIDTPDFITPEEFETAWASADSEENA